MTVDTVREADAEELTALALPSLRRMLRLGVTTVEIKSGYGLTVDHELKMLEAIRLLRDRQPIELVATYLAAHTVPSEFEGRADNYLNDVLADAVLARIRDERLAEFLAALGDTATSLEHYRAFLSIWKSADADLPILGEGRRFIEAN